MQLDINSILKTLDELVPPMLPDYGGTCQGRGGTESGLSLQGGGAFGGELKGKSYCYMFE